MREEGEWAVAQWRWRSCKQDHVAQGAKVLTPRDEISKPGTWTRDSPPMSTFALNLALVKSGQLTRKAVERWGIDRFVRMENSKKPGYSVKLANLRSQLIYKVVL